MTLSSGRLLSKCLQVNGPVGGSGKVVRIIELRSSSLHVIVHICHPLGVVVDQEVGADVGPLLGDFAAADDLSNLRVGDVAARVCAASFCGVGYARGTGEFAHWPSTTGLGHLERPAVAGHTDNHLSRGHASLGDHRQGISGLCVVDMDLKQLPLGQPDEVHLLP